MKNTKSTILSLALAALAPLTFAQEAPAPAPAPAPAATPSPEEIKVVFSYLMGQQYGNQMAMEANTLRIDDFDAEVFRDAFERFVGDAFAVRADLHRVVLEPLGAGEVEDFFRGFLVREELRKGGGERKGGRGRRGVGQKFSSTHKFGSLGSANVGRKPVAPNKNG